MYVSFLCLYKSVKTGSNTLLLINYIYEVYLQKQITPFKQKNYVFLSCYRVFIVLVSCIFYLFSF